MYVVGQVVKYYGRAGVEFALYSHVLSVLISLQLAVGTSHFILWDRGSRICSVVTCIVSAYQLAVGSRHFTF
jgi:hypothetical protein